MRGGGGGRQPKHAKTAAIPPRPLQRNLEPKLKSVSAQPSPVHEESVMSPVLEEPAHQSPAHYLPIVLSDNLVGKIAEVPPVQHESMVINSPSPLNFMENQEMPKLNLN